MPGPLVVGVTGASGSGKTALVAGLLRRLAADGVRAAAVKHAAHGFALDRPESDSTRLAEAGAGIVADSVPATEHDEVLAKSGAMARALELAEEGL